MSRFRFKFKDAVFSIVDGMKPMNRDDMFLALVLKLTLIDIARHQHPPVESTVCLLFRGGDSVAKFIHVGHGLRNYKGAKDFRRLSDGEFRYTALDREIEAIFKRMAEEMGGGRPDRKGLSTSVTPVDIPRVVRPKSVSTTRQGDISVEWNKSILGEPYL